MKHVLGLEIPNTSNPYTLSIWDSSTYDSALGVDCLRLDIYPPGYTLPVYYYDLTEGFNKNLNARDLEIQTVITLTTKVTAIAIANGGTGYSVSDVLTLSTGTGTAATITVATVNGSGVIQTVALTTAGVYTVDPTQLNSPTTVAPAGGTGATFNLTMGINTSSSQDLFQLPDGVYQIRYSVSPNDYVYVEYLHLRTTRVRNLYANEICKLRSNCCSPSQKDKEKLLDLRYIRQLIEAAEFKVKVRHAVTEGTAMLADAERLLIKYKTKGCLSC